MRRSLDGLSAGDAFGQQFFSPHIAAEANPHNFPPPPWPYTDDTEMAIALAETLLDRGEVDQDVLAEQLVRRYRAEPHRGYGAGARRLLEDIDAGGCWRTLSSEMFGGSGSYGNGAAMRVAPLGAWFADDVEETIRQATLSAEVTHSHPEAQVGAIAVAIAAGWVARHDGEPASELVPWVVSRIDDSEVRRRLEWTASCPLDTWAFTIASQVGGGDEISAQDTVPFCIWMAAAHLSDFGDAMWVAARVGGDIDTTCAIIGGIVASKPGNAVPPQFLQAREPLRWLDPADR